MVAPAVSPPTKSRCIERKSSAIGSVITTEAAITAPQSVLNSVENSARPIGSVLTELVGGEAEREDELVPGGDEGVDQDRDDAGHARAAG